ncbi:MAG: TRAP transporter large permease [Burkholderiales bacterium]|jgi:tripartite ATP-independent transporter DctM subunit|nr:TRAP transporter large permease [Burkholderiales bacterium]
MSAVLFGGFLLLLLAGVPLATALGISGAVVILAAELGAMSIAANVYSSLAKYPLLALPVFILAGMIFERAGVAAKLVAFVAALIGPRRGAQGAVAIIVCMFLGGISGSGPADAAAVAMVMLPSMTRQGYPPAFSASIIAAAGSTAILIPPSIAFVIFTVLVPQVSVPALFAAGMIPGVLAGLSLLVPAVLFARRYGWGSEDNAERQNLLAVLKDASWGIAAPVIILGGLRTGAFTPTEAAVVAVFYGLFVGTVVYRTLDFRKLYRVLVDSAEISAVVMLIIACAGIFAHAGSTLGAFDAMARAMLGITQEPWLMLAMIMALLLVAGMLLDAASIFLIFLPILIPVVDAFGWDMTWFAVLMTMNMAIGQFTPPMAVNLLVTTRIAGVGVETTVRWVLWMMFSMLCALALVAAFPQLALWLPARLGY